MKKSLVLILLILMGTSNSSFSQESELGAEVEGTSCTSMGPDNKGYCTKYTNGNGTSSYTCLKVGAGCVDCVY